MALERGPAAPAASSPARALGLAGLAPLLAFTGDAVTGLGLGAANALALLLLAAPLAWLSARLSEAIRLPAQAIVVATVVTALALALQAALPALHAGVAVLLPLVAVNGLLLGLAAGGAREALATAARLAAAGALVLPAFGALREMLGQGTLFAGAGDRLGWPAIEIVLGPRGPWLLASLPPGGLLLLGGLLALRRPARGEGP